ncbi:MAG: type IX secretion system protein PorQ [Chitinophagaceae bacterium]|nr:type IX secretion system protein PorQ [Chitinophagaceae bacterium]
MLTRFYILLLLIFSVPSSAQVIGGSKVLNFLSLSRSPHETALGGNALSNPSRDVMMSASNPALLRPEFNSQLGLNYNFYYAGSRITNLLYAHHDEKLKTTFGLGLQYLDYGTFKQTDVVGNVQGEVSAAEFMVSLHASRSYLERWRYGASLKYARSRLADKQASGLMLDIGLMYADTNAQWYMAAALKNAGLVIKNYTPGAAASLPLDLQVGITKRFKKAPFSLSVLGHHLYTWDIRYDNPADQVNNQLLFTDTNAVEKKKTYFADKLFRHLVFGLEINLGKRVEISVGYNHLRRAELGYAEKKGIAGFSFGAGLYLNKFVIHYAQSYFHIAGAHHEMGLNLRLNQLFGFGKYGNRINWTEKYAQSYK